MIRMRYILALTILAMAFGSAWADNEWLARGWPEVHHDGSNSGTSPALGTGKSWTWSLPGAAWRPRWGKRSSY